MTRVSPLVESLTRIVGEEAERLAHEVGCIQRERVLSSSPGRPWSGRPCVHGTTLS